MLCSSSFGPLWVGGDVVRWHSDAHLVDPVRQVGDELVLEAQSTLRAHGDAIGVVISDGERVDSR